jgi:hypothetical protein
VTTQHDDPGSYTRRRLLRIGGTTVSLAALVAACGDGGDEEAGAPGRVGYAPPATPLPPVEVNDAVYLRTATSLEVTILDIYAAITESGVLEGEAQALIDELIADHREDVETTARLTREAGGEPYECANSWYVDRVFAPVVPQITGDEAEDIPPSDDPAKDALAVANALESLMTATYQQFVELLDDRDLRAEVVTIGARDARHAAAVAMLSTGVPEGYVSPALMGAEILPDEDGRNPLYAIPTRFGSLAAVELLVGAPNDTGTRFSTSFETPSTNAFIYEGETCDA